MVVDNLGRIIIYEVNDVPHQINKTICTVLGDELTHHRLLYQKVETLMY